MITFDNALNNVRKQFPKHYVCSGFDFNDEYVFEIVSHEYKNLFMDQSLLVSVEKQNGDVSIFDSNKAFDNLEKFSEARNKEIQIDQIDKLH